nr:MAG TPA: hypothetical protein [Caudoviricetes sp.]
MLRLPRHKCYGHPVISVTLPRLPRDKCPATPV